MQYITTVYLTNKSNWDIDVISVDEYSARLKHLLCCSSPVRLSKIFAAKSCDRLIHAESDSWSFETSSSICLPLGKKYCTLLFYNIGIVYKKFVSITTFSKICFTFLDKLQKNLSGPINPRAAQNIAEGRVVSIPARGSDLSWNDYISITA